MSKKDDPLASPSPKSPKGPTPDDLKRLSVQKEWLDKNIDWKALQRLAYRDIRDSVVGGDLVQELYSEMLQMEPEELRGLRTPMAFANVAIKRKAINWRRDRPRTESLSHDHDQFPDETPSMDEVLESREQVLDLLAELSPEWAEPWVLCRYYGYTYEETAQRLGLSVDAVKMRLMRADAHLEVLATAPKNKSTSNRLRNLVKRKERFRDK